MRRARGVAAAVAIQAVAASAVALVALDLYAHKKLDDLAGLNIWGYRGAVAHQKGPREIRIAVVGGTRAFGLGMPASWTIATVLRQQVMLVTDRRGGEVRQVVALTLARPGGLPDSYADAIRRYAYLQPDYICIDDDLGVGGAPLPQETSGIFARTGYWPVLPLAIREKGMAWRFGSVRAGYVADAPRRPGNVIRRGSGAVMEATGALLSRADRLFAPAARRHDDDPARYAEQMSEAITAALAHASGVVVAVNPAETSRQSANLAALRPLIDAQLETTNRLRFISLQGEPLLTDPAQRLDDWNYGGDAIAAAAKAITPSVLDLIGRLDRAPSATR